MKYTVILLCWKRFGVFEDILKFWLSQKKVDEIIVFDNSGSFKTDLPVTVINSNRNLFSGARIPIVQFAKNDAIIFCDDDIIPQDGIIEDFEKYYNPKRVIGILGVTFTGTSYENSPRIKAKEIRKLTEVGYIAWNLCMLNRKLCLNLDINDCPNWQYLDDFWWAVKIVKEGSAHLYIMPTDKFEMSIDSDDKYACHMSGSLRNLRNVYYRKWIIKKEVEGL